MQFAHHMPLLSSEQPPHVPPRRAADEFRLTDRQLATRILIIEDEIMIAWMIESLLTDAGFSDVEIAADAERACDAAERLMPGLVLSDVNLGAGADGIDATLQIVGERSIPVIFVTANADPATRARIQRGLPDARLLHKPVHAHALFQAVVEALSPKANH